MNNKQSQISVDLEFDKKHIWHPYTSMTAPLPVYPVVSANKNIITLESGENLIDGMASWWSAIHGYNHPVLNEALTNQISQMSHIMFGGITHAPAVNLCKKLIEITPEQLTKVFLADSGSVAVEVAIKMALQYWQSQNIKNKTKLMTVTKGYHGDTFAAMSICDPINSMHALYQDFLPQHIFAPAPISSFDAEFDANELNILENYFIAHHENVAAFIIEPIVQNAGGMNFYHPDYLAGLSELCDKYNVLLICDEIATGFGRTGKMFAVEHAKITPDIMCIGKAITGGYMTLSATLTSDKIAKGISEGAAGVMMHGPTFMGNPLACSVACASIDLLLASNWQNTVQDLNAWLTQFLAPCNDLEQVENVRILGAIGVVEIDKVVDVAQFQKKCIEQGVWIRPYGKLIYLMPPYITPKNDIKKLADVIYSILDI
ncbi:adenosylmethionine--8-amino-7-oxononanoate transaminase [Pseudoalteromonas sp. NBT06-2]|uniref:adenosylmethionine--8-amino-7-oxononanoate transaminase n=1 Tax=Pseudoalteromonas sp. NBT06-2 TaxID=2025950 RepID=UPI000BA7CAB1|nr:adenosylmethionine--8-amino-7-oxononanoate transaminase [Pseudoalteromonas sp. NBT06-2]PAJ73651.1 adenosylmethionine--8-amino-7-oxononanoate transaminase [Pseudoalteromonas sp. NBT06-2]